MDNVKPIYKKFLIAAIAVYVIGTSVIMSDLYYKVCRMEHLLAHAQSPCVEKHR